MIYFLHNRKKKATNKPKNHEKQHKKKLQNQNCNGTVIKINEQKLYFGHTLSMTQSDFCWLRVPMYTILLGKNDLMYFTKSTNLIVNYCFLDIDFE